MRVLAILVWEYESVMNVKIDEFDGGFPSSTMHSTLMERVNQEIEDIDGNPDEILFHDFRTWNILKRFGSKSFSEEEEIEGYRVQRGNIAEINIANNEYISSIEWLSYNDSGLLYIIDICIDHMTERQEFATLDENEADFLRLCISLKEAGVETLYLSF